jgi:MerR family transcriptional regulator, heat shock protein HspR
MRLPNPNVERGVYGISVATGLLGMGVQTLRLYAAV